MTRDGDTAGSNGVGGDGGGDVGGGGGGGGGNCLLQKLATTTSTSGLHGGIRNLCTKTDNVYTG